MIGLTGPAEEELAFFTDFTYTGFGLSEGLSRGIQVAYMGQPLTQEAMGIGAAAIKRGGLTYFSRETIQEPGEFCYTCCMDSAMIPHVMGRSFRWLSRLWHLGTAVYRRVPARQEMLLSWAKELRNLLRITNRFAGTPLQGSVRFEAVRCGSGLDVRCVIRSPFRNAKVCIMNEIGADWFTAGWQEGVEMAPPPPWQALDHSAPLPSLYSEQLGLLFSIRNISLDREIPFQVFWGREKHTQLCWTGYTIEIDLRNVSTGEVTCTYRVDFKAIKKES